MAATVWLLPYSPHCDSLASDPDPAIARVNGECIRLSHYAERLRTIEAGIEYAEGEPLPDDPSLDPIRERHHRVLRYGPETVALADAIRDSALFQQAVAEGHTLSDEEVAARTGLDRRRSEASRDPLELARMANESDSAGFKELLESSKHPDLQTIAESSTIPELMESMRGWEEEDFRWYEKALAELEKYLQSVGSERYWNEIHPAKLRREISTAKLEEAVLEASTEGPYEDVPRLAWLAYRQETLDNANITLTDAAPLGANLAGTLAYLAELRESDRRSLAEGYREFLERREERQRLTPTPSRQISSPPLPKPRR